MTATTNDGATVLPMSSCNSGLVWSLYYVDIVIRNVLRVYFRDHPNYGMDGIASLVWRPDNRTDGGNNPLDTIRIDLVDAWNPSRVDSLPAILTKTNEIGSSRIGIGDRNMFPMGDTVGGSDTYTRTWAGSATVFCLSRKAREAKLLSLAAAAHLGEFATDIRNGLRLRRFEVQKIGEPRPLREFPDAYAATVSIDFGTIATWTVYPEADRLDKIQFSSTTH